MKSLRSLLPALFLSLLATPVLADHHGAKGSIVDVATQAGNFKTLITAIDAADLTATLEGEGPFTVFAPTDEAFAALPEGTLQTLLGDPRALAEVLTYHVVAGRVTASQVVGMSSAETLEGGSLAISATDGVMINDANVVSADVEASNGVIHVIDKVLIP